MYLLILLLVPFLFLFHTYLGMGGLIVAIVAMYVERTRPSNRRRPRRDSESVQEAGHEDWRAT